MAIQNYIPKLMDEKEAAAVLGVRRGTMRKWRWSGKGPKFLKISNAVRYSVDDLQAFITAASRQNTSEQCAPKD